MPLKSSPSTNATAPQDRTTVQHTLAEAGSKSLESEFFNPIPPGYQPGRHKFVAVFGTVISGLGKGIFSSSLAKLLKDKGLRVAPIKMEGYLNIDSGTLNPFRHGEVFVLDDGMETDMDLGTYERLLDQDLTRDNFTTSGQLFRGVLDKERHGLYLGRDVQMIPHVTGEVKYQLRQLAVRQNADVVFVEVGGTVGDYENWFYIEALRQLAFEEGEDSVCFVALTYVIEPPSLGEQKSKAAQQGLKKLMETGIKAHLIAVRAQNEVQLPARQKIAMFAGVPQNRVFSMHDRTSIYLIPDAIRAGRLDNEILTILDLHGRVDPVHEDEARQGWNRFMHLLRAPRRYDLRIGITGKYTALRDAYASIDKALEHAGTHLGAAIEPVWIDTSAASGSALTDQLRSLHGVIVPGGFGIRGIEGKVECVRFCRESGLPFMGICLGFQMAVIEFARHVCGMQGANSTEFDPKTPAPVISELPEQKLIEGLGGSMRLGGKDVLIKPDTLAAFLFGDPEHPAHELTIRQRFRHRYEVEPSLIPALESHGLIFSGRHPQQPIMQVLELPASVHPYFIGSQFHPELLSRPLRPHPMFMGLVAAALRRGFPNIDPGQISPRWLRGIAPAGPTGRGSDAAVCKA